MRMFLIMNPGSHGGKSGRLFSGILSALRVKGVDFNHTITSTLDDIAACSTAACRNDYDIIVSVGGDGTINRVVNGFFDDAGNLISASRLGVIYTGTSPDFCRSYRLPLKTADALALILRSTLNPTSNRTIPLGCIQLAPVHDPVGVDLVTRYFSCCANIGLGARMAAIANSGIRKLTGDHLGSFLALLRAVVTTRVVDFEMVRDGQREQLTAVRNISIGLTRYIASGIKVAHQLAERDDRFYTMTVRNLTLAGLPGVLRDIYGGGSLTSSSVSLEYARTLDIPVGPQPVEVEFDGDPAGFLPCRISLARDRLPLIGSQHEE